MRLSLLAGVLSLSAAVLFAQDNPSHESKPASPGQDPERFTQVVRLRNVPAKEAAAGVENFLRAKHELARLRDDSITAFSFVIEAEAVTNSLLISADRRMHDEIVALIREIDRDRMQLTISMNISIKSADGRTRNLSRPVIRTLNGTAAALEIGIGQVEWQAGDSLEIQLTPNVLGDE